MNVYLIAGLVIAYLWAQANSAGSSDLEVVSPDGTDPVNDALGALGGLASVNATTYSGDAVAATKQAEGESLSAYPDAGGWSIGFGHHIASSGETESDAQATEDLGGDLDKAANVVNNAVNVDLTQGMFDALVCFVYNVGAGKFLASTLLRRLNAGDYQGAYEQFPRWVHSSANGVLVVNPGLAARRRVEQALWQRDGLPGVGA